MGERCFFDAGGGYRCYDPTVESSFTGFTEETEDSTNSPYCVVHRYGDEVCYSYDSYNNTIECRTDSDGNQYCTSSTFIPPPPPPVECFDTPDGRTYCYGADGSVTNSTHSGEAGHTGGTHPPSHHHEHECYINAEGNEVCDVSSTVRPPHSGGSDGTGNMGDSNCRYGE